MKFNELKILSDNTKAATLTKSLHMTNEDFQNQLNLMRTLNKPTKETKLISIAKYHIVNSNYSALSCGNNETNYTYYVKFINDVLKSILKGKVDYCYNIGQVKELLRFIPDLKVSLCDFYFEVSI